MCQRSVCQKREFTVRPLSCEVFPKLKNSLFFRINMKHSYFCFQSIFLLLKLLFAKINTYVLVYEVTNLTLYMYLFIEIF